VTEGTRGLVLFAEEKKKGISSAVAAGSREGPSPAVSHKVIGEKGRTSTTMQS